VTEMMPRWVQRVSRRLLELPRSQKRLLMLFADLVCIPAALWTAMTLKAGAPVHDINEDAWLYLAALLASVPVFTRLGLYRAVVRFIGPRALVAVVAGVTMSVVLLLIVNDLLLGKGVHISTFAIYWALALIYVGGSRLLARGLIHIRRMGSDRVAIYGAGAAGAQVASALLGSGRYYPVAFIDDSRGLQGSSINGIEVFSPDELPTLIAEEGVNTVLLALPSLSRRRRQEILHTLEPLEVHVQTVPDISDIVTGRATVEDIREVDTNDLLGRDPVPPREELFGTCIRGRVVMVTGAGGSIGAELCRQIARLGPSRIVLFEMSELALYNIERELSALVSENALPVHVVALLGNAHHRSRVREVIQAYGVQTIYHAAAYKHVPIVEQNIVEGVHNNVFSTWFTAEAAVECGVDTFVLVSTDKAVNPTNVMGATKRLAEIVLQGLQQRGSQTRFCMVRFGNVLESSGSVVPLFREQIRRGGPVTVTHPEVIRYFMTIPEATQLVLQAGAIAKGGDVLVLDMGKPVRIQDLARRMVRLMGLTVRDDKNPDGDIEIVYTGLRPAEKLFEELLIGGTVTGTEHPMIMRAVEHSLPWASVQLLLSDLLEAINRFDCGAARDLLTQAVVEYRPVNDIQDHVWQRKLLTANAEPSKVTDLQARRARVQQQGA
jgi:UDP-N-acetylglucosamine 4,6-dehydratase